MATRQDYAESQLTAAAALQGARNALAVANASTESQLAVFGALQAAAEAAEAAEREGSATAAVLGRLAQSRGGLLCRVADRTVKQAKKTHDKTGVAQGLADALRAARRIYAAVRPKDKKGAEFAKAHKELTGTEADDEPAVRPFFARFLENQNRNRVATRASVRERKPLECIVTLKEPSDHEDPGSDLGEDIAVTLKAPSDEEDQGAGGDIVTRKFPSDEEDAGFGGVAITLKFPSDHSTGR